MNKKIIAAAIAASFIAPAAMAEVTIYGKIRQSVDFVDMSDNAGNSVDNVQINDKTSRIGFKGSEDLGDGLKAIFGLEYGVAISSGNGNVVADGGRNEFSGSGALSARNAFVGIAGDFGTVLVGRHDHPVKISTGQFDFFSDTAADNNNTYQIGADLRADGTIAYVSPNFSGLTVLAAIVPAEGGSVSSSVPEADTNDGMADAYSIAATYSNGGLAIAGGYEEGDRLMNGVNAATDYEQWRIGVGYTMDALSVNVVYTDIDKAYDSWKIAAKYTMGNNEIMAQYWDVDGENTATSDAEADGWDIGVAHNFSKRTQVMALYSTADASESVSGYDGDSDIFSVQLNHNF